MIDPYFTPPVEFKDNYGDYRSPLKFYNGDTVRTKQDWREHQEEIRNRWMEMMGEWHLVIDDRLFILHYCNVNEHLFSF